MIEAIFYKYNGKYNALPKTLGEGTTLPGLLRDTCDRATPTLTVRSASPMFDFNYCYIPTFGRYYFIDRIDVQSNDTYRLTLSVDVLQTYHKQILSSDCTVNYSVSPNPYINNRANMYDVRPQLKKIDFENKNVFDKEGTIIMITLKGNK